MSRRSPVYDSLSIVIPAYNEADRLPQSLARVLAWMTDADVQGEVIVVDDGSRDNTAALAEALAATEPRLSVLRQPENRGKGAAVRRGVEVSREAWVLFTDADLSTPIEDVARLARAADAGAEVIIGSRDVSESDIEQHQPWYREAMGRTFNRIVQTLAVPGLKDTQCGFKLFSREAARRCFGHMVIERFAFDVEVLFLARRFGYTVAEVGVRWRNDERSTVDPLRDSTRMFFDVLRIRMHHRGLRSDEP